MLHSWSPVEHVHPAKHRMICGGRKQRVASTSSRVKSFVIWGSIILTSIAVIHLYRSLQHEAGTKAASSIVKGAAQKSFVASTVSQKNALVRPNASALSNLNAVKDSQKSVRLATQPEKLPYPIWWAAPFYSISGYGTEAVAYVTGLLDFNLVRPSDLRISQSGDSVSDNLLRSLDGHTRETLFKADFSRMKSKLPRDELDRKAIVICHSFPDCWVRNGERHYPASPGCPCPTAEMRGKVAIKIGRSMFETAALPMHLAQHAREFDEIWVPSEFNRQSFMRSGVSSDKIFILPEGIDTDVFDPVKHSAVSLVDMGALRVIGPARKPGSKPFIFLSVFKWELRKGWDLLLKAYTQEFTPDDNVELHIVTHPFMEMVGDWRFHIRQLMRTRLGISEFATLAPVYVYSSHIPDSKFPGIYQGANALVVPTRGEGWGRPQMEAMSMALPVISTNWSGITAFLHEGVGYPLKIDGLEKAVHDGPSFFGFFKGQEWASPSVSHLRQLMRHVVNNQQEAHNKGVAAREHLLKEFSPHAIALKLFAHVKRVEKKLQAKEG